MSKPVSDTKPPLDAAQLNAALDRVHAAGIPGVFAEVRAVGQVWRSAAGMADVTTGDPVTPDMKHRIGSVTKAFTSAAVLQQIQRGELQLDAPVGQYLPRLVPGERGRAITVRMLLNHTSGLAEYLPSAYPSLAAFPRLADTTPQSLDDHQFKQFARTDLIQMGVTAPPVGTPGGTPGVYSNTNYLLLCELLELLTGAAAEACITENVIERAGLQHTEFPASPRIEGAHSRLYEAWFGMIDPPRDYSVFDMSWVGPAASLISTVADLNRFFALLLEGAIVDRTSLAQMQSTVPVISQEGKKIEYGLGLHRREVPGCGTFWGHDGSVWGGGAMSMASADGKRQMSVAINLQRWNALGPQGKPLPHPIDEALASLYALAMCGASPSSGG
jgi:D-alanyl-D-alanine carboxypeptidase